MHFWNLFLTALMSVLKILLITLVGTILSLDRFSLLKDDARKHVNSLVFFVFVPTLSLSNLAKAMTIKSLAMLWFMPLNILLTFIIGSSLGWLLIKITRVPHHLQGLILACCAAGNMGSMPLMIIPTVCNEASSPFGDKDVCNRNGLAYASLTQAIGNILMWTYAYNLIRIYACKSSNENSSVKSSSTPETDPENGSACEMDPSVTSRNISQPNEVESAKPKGDAKLSLQVTKREKIRKLFRTLVETINLKALLAPSTIGAIIGLIIGIVPVFHNAFVGDKAPLHVVQSSISMLGDAAIPTMTLLAGATLLDGLRGSGMRLSIILGILLVRFIALPMCGIGILKGAMHVGMIHHPDPLYRFLLLIQYSFPPAISISTVTQMFGASESECSLVMLVTYACAAISLTLWSTFFMWFVL